MKTDELIASLGEEMPANKLKPPMIYAMRFLVIIAVYAASLFYYFGLRPDLLDRLMQPWYAAEIAILAVLTCSSAAAAILSQYPDMYQKRWMLSLAYGSLVALAIITTGQWLVMEQGVSVLDPNLHQMQCTTYIAAVAVIPSILLFWQIRKGASTRPWHAGICVVLAAAGVGCLTLRLIEANDSMFHLVVTHYLPIIGFSMLGAIAGKLLLKW